MVPKDPTDDKLTDLKGLFLQLQKAKTFSQK